MVAQQAGTRASPDRTDGEMSVRSGILARVVRTAAALGVALAACSNSSDPVGSVASGPATGDAPRIEAADGNRFTPATLELPAGEKVTIEIINTDDAAHDFAIEAAGLNTGTIQGDAVATATFTVPEGTTKFVCTFHRGMTGTIEGVARAEG
jgi:nitrite reductase (NO-forming)